MYQHKTGGKRGMALPHGAYSTIARRLRPKVTPNHVREVWLGNRTSPRVERAIQTYLRAMQEAGTLPDPSPDSDTQQAA